jgi:hypothetical protein
MRNRLIVLAVLLLGVTGCQKLNVQGTTELPMASTKRFEIGAPAYNQTVHVTIEPADVSVSAFIVKTADADEAERAVAPGKAPPEKYVLGGKTFKSSDSRQDFNFEATVPAKTPFTLLLCGGRRTTKVKYKVVGR